MQKQTTQAAIAAVLEIPVRMDDLYTVGDLAAQFPRYLSTPTLRWQLRERDTNGLAYCCVKSGKKLLVSKSRYERWLACRADVPV